MKKLLLLTLFVCIGSINAQERIVFGMYDEEGFDRIYKYYKNALGDKYEIIKNNNIRDLSENDVEFWNEVIIRDYKHMIGKINKINFGYLDNISSIKSENTITTIYSDKRVTKKYILSTINFDRLHILTSREIRTKDDRDDLREDMTYYDYTYGFCCSKVIKYYNYKDKLVNFSKEGWASLGNNYLKEVRLYGSTSGIVDRNYDDIRLKAIINYDGGNEFKDENMAMLKRKKNGITSYYYTHGKLRNNPSISHLFIQDRYIVSQEYKLVNKNYRLDYSTTEFEFVYQEPRNMGDEDSNINEFDIIPMIELFIEDHKGFMEYYYGLHFESSYIPGKQKITATFEPLEGNTLAMSYGYGKDDQIIIKIDPEKWAKASSIKRWYILYHELGHDYLNLEHGQGGKMMFNFPLSSEITIENFVEDRNYMFKSLLSWF